MIGGKGRTVYLKGQVALDANGEVVGEGDVVLQVEQVLRNMAAILDGMGGRISDIVSLQQFSTDIQSFMGWGEVRARFFSVPVPVTTTLKVASLYDPRLLIEITGIAEIPVDRFVMPDAAQETHQ